MDHQKRRDIIRYVGEKRAATFTEILNAVKIPDSPTLSYHIRSLTPFLRQENGKYNLTPIGKAAYNLLLRTAVYDKLALLQKNRYEATLGNALVWSTAIAAAAFLKVDATLSSIILPILAGVNLYVTYKLLE